MVGSEPSNFFSSSSVRKTSPRWESDRACQPRHTDVGWYIDRNWEGTNVEILPVSQMRCTRPVAPPDAIFSDKPTQHAGGEEDEGDGAENVKEGNSSAVFGSDARCWGRDCGRGGVVCGLGVALAD